MHGKGEFTSGISENEKGKAVVGVWERGKLIQV
jgi:hypothetical protein